jgi:RNA polymerase sigma-70 factor (ECF subfamily)
MSSVSELPAGDGDSALCRRLVLGDASAEREFVERFSGRIMAMGVARTRDIESARELVNDVLLAALTALRRGTVRDTDRLGAFVHGTAVNLINNHLRSRLRHPVPGPLPEDLAGADGPERQETAADLHVLHRCVQELPELDRAILTLAIVEGLDYVTVAARTGLSPDAVRQRKARALGKLKEILATPSLKGLSRPQGRW